MKHSNKGRWYLLELVLVCVWTMFTGLLFGMTLILSWDNPQNTIMYLILFFVYTEGSLKITFLLLGKIDKKIAFNVKCFRKHKKAIERKEAA